MAEKPYKIVPAPKLKRDMVGRHVILKCSLKNGVQILPPGTICWVNKIYRGLELWSEKCPCCGVKAFISKVPYCDVEFIEYTETEGCINMQE